jgi:hypothetical protein
MTLKHFWKLWPAVMAVLFLTLAAPALSQPVQGGPNVTVYENPT